MTHPVRAPAAASTGSIAPPLPETTLDWLIIGGGIHGVHLGVRLLGEAEVPPERLRVVDPGPRLLDTWRRCTANTGMRFLRSPAVHHLDLEPFSLLRFARSGRRRRDTPNGAFAAPYNRPSLDLFAAHCDDVVSRFALDALHVQDVATGISLSCDGVSVELGGGGAVSTRNVLLAVGSAGRPRWPEWARALERDGARIHHVFEAGFDLDPEAWPARVAVVGGGITAAQVALRLADAGREVHLVSRHPLREHQFDSDPGWLGPRNMQRFSATSDLGARRRMIAEARHAGSVPSDVHRALLGAIRQGTVRWHQSAVQAAAREAEVALSLDQEQLAVDAVLLATGFVADRPGGPLVDQLVDRYALPCAACGFPVVDAHLRWHPQVFVTGPLAELELGPSSRNIAGARRAAERIVQVAREAS